MSYLGVHESLLFQNANVLKFGSKKTINMSPLSIGIGSLNALNYS